MLPDTLKHPNTSRYSTHRNLDGLKSLVCKIYFVKMDCGYAACLIPHETSGMRHDQNITYKGGGSEMARF